MSMTREEAIEFFGQYIDNDCYTDKCQDAHRMALTALRGPTREMVERMFPGCAYCKLDSEGYVREFGSHYIWDGELKTEYCKPQKIKFCPHCSRPLTDEAVDILWRKWKEAVDGETD